MTILAYQQAWNAGYIWDDDKYVTENPLLTAPDGLRRIWFSLDSPSQYFPLVYTTFRLEHAIWGLNASGYHWVNILLHAANALLVWWLLRLLAVPGAWLAAALFALHPVNVESVAWITERKNVLMGVFFLLALRAWLRFVDGEGRAQWRYYILALVLYALSLFSKTTACTMPAALLLILWWKRMPITAARIVHVTPFVVLGIAMGLLTIWWERNIQGTQGELFSMPLIERVLVAGRAIWFYLGKLAWPADLAFSYPRWDISASNPADYRWLLLTLGGAAAIYFSRRFVGRGPEVAAVYYVAMLSPMLGLIMLYTFRYTFVADHYQYLATIGPLAVVAALAASAAGRFRSGGNLLANGLLAGVLLVPLGLRTWQQCAIYKDEETLWRATIAVNPASWMAHNNLGIIQLRRSEFDAAIAQFRSALQIDPNYAEAHYNLGNALLRRGDTEEAIREYIRAIELNPLIVSAYVNLGQVLTHSGRAADAVAYLQDAVSIAPTNAAARGTLGAALARIGRSAEALEHLRAAAELDPRSLEVQIDLANSLLDAGWHEEAVGHLETAVQIDPGSAEAHYNLGNALLALRRWDDAVRNYRRAVELRPEYAAARNNLANTLVQLGWIEEGIREYQAVIAIRPGYAAAHKNLANALRRAGRLEEAAEHSRQAAAIEAAAAEPQRR
jgi:tetratricopeptide (TPR) repeat protein